MKIDYLRLIKSTGAINSGHFVLTSGRHIGRYINKDCVSAYPKILDILAKNVAKNFELLKIDVVASSATGAIAFGNRVAEHIGSKVNSIYAEQVGDKFVFRRNYSEFVKSKTRVLIIDDIVTTGRTTRLMIKAVKNLGGVVVGIGLIWDGGVYDFGVPVFACVTDKFEHFNDKSCPFCKERTEIDTKINKHGTKFIEEYGKNPSNWPANRKKL